MPFDPSKVKWATANNAREVLMFLFVWLPLRIVLVKALWSVFGTDVTMTWGVATFIAFVCPFVRPNLVLHYNSMQMPLELFTQRRGTAGMPN
jgi:hypothetical protein